MHSIERVRHESRFRKASVVLNERITPALARITLAHPEFAAFRSLVFDDHVKLFFAPSGEELASPTLRPDGLDFGTQLPQCREYTPRSFDTDRAEIVIDFVIHGDGLASRWAETARPGDTLGVSGPRSSFVVTGEFDWLLLAGDETGLPAIARCLEGPPAQQRVIAILEVRDRAETQQVAAPDMCELVWLYRDGGQSMEGAVEAFVPPPGSGFAFVAGEAAAIRTARAALCGKGVAADCIRATAYWHCEVETR